MISYDWYSLMICFYVFSEFYVVVSVSDKLHMDKKCDSFDCIVLWHMNYIYIIYIEDIFVFQMIFFSSALFVICTQ